ncbi:MAG: LamG domain-containing protein, partial [Pedobacter sp.]
MKKIIFAFLLFPLIATAQKDTSFWFAAPDIVEFSQGTPHDKPILFRLTSFSAAAVVTISLPANQGFAPIVTTINANSTSTVDLSPWADQIENSLSNTVVNKGILIHSTAAITAYYEVVSTCNCNPELFALKGRSALGNEFIISSQKEWPIDTIRFPSARSAFNLAATENNTVITITPSQPLLNRPAGVPFVISLNRGQTFSNQGQYRDGASMLNGSIVTSNKPIAVTFTEDLLMSDGPCADLAGDQIIPTAIWGDEFVVIRGALTDKDKAVITAMTNNTSIYLNGSTTAAAVINRGQSYEYNLTAATLYLKSSNKVSVYHYTGINCEVGSAVIPKINCTGSQDVAITRSIDESAEVFIVTRQGNQGFFTVNGSAATISAADFLPVAGSGGAYVYCKKNMNSDMITGIATRFINSAGKFSLGFANGATPFSYSGCRYGYFSDFKSSSVSSSQMEICPLDSAQLTAFGGISYQWSPSVGLSSNNIANPKASPSITTDYKVIITTAEGCVDSSFVRVVVKNDCVPQAVPCNNWLSAPAQGALAQIGDLDVPGTHITVEAVFNRTAPYNGGPLYAGDLVSKHNFYTDVNYLLRPNSAEITTSNGYFVAEAPCEIELNKTYHVAMTYDGATLKFYRNGILLRQVPATGTLYQNNINTNIGLVDYPPAQTQFIGYINEVRIWNVVRTQVDIQAFMHTTLPYPTSQPGLLSYHSFNNLLNKQGNSLHNASLYGGASINNINPNCQFTTSGGSTNAFAGNDVSFCSNSPVSHNLSGSGTGTTYSWQPAALLNNSNIANPIATVSATTKFYLTVSGPAGCTSIDSVTVAVNPLPVVTSYNDTSFCSNTTLSLSASGAATYSWTPATAVSNPAIANPVYT